MNELPPPVRRVVDAAARLDLDITIRLMGQSTRTAADAARACDCDVAQIVKSLIFKGKTTERPVLALVAGVNRVDEAALAGHLGEPVIRPDADFVRTTSGFAIGGVPPFGHTTTPVPFFDADLLAFDTVWAAAGTPNAVFDIDPRRLRDALGAPAIEVRG